MKRPNKAGWREVGGKRCYFRSKMEANYARVLELIKKNGSIRDWEYEPFTFWFEEIKRGVRSYKPDFKVTNPDGTIEWHEVKGWMDPKSKTKLKRMRIYYPKEKVRVIDTKYYRTIKRQCQALIHDWE